MDGRLATGEEEAAEQATMADKPERRATYADIESAPEHLVAEIIDGVPFDAVSFSLADLWPLDKPLRFNEDPQALYAGDR